jgi:hypothetical protein
VDQVLKWFFQCGSGLEYLHSLPQPIIHRLVFLSSRFIIHKSFLNKPKNIKV